MTANSASAPEFDLSVDDFRLFLDGTPDVVYVQRAGIVTFVNAAFLRAMGADNASQYVGKRLVEEVIAPQDRDENAVLISDPDPLAVRPTAEVRLLRVDGSVATFVYTGVRLGDVDDWATVVLCRDVSAQREQADAVRRAEREFRLVFESAPIGMLFMGLDDYYIHANRAFCSLIGYEEDELRQLRLSDVTHPDDLAGDAEFIRHLLNTGGERAERRKRYRRKDGSYVDISLNVSLLRDPDGNPLGFVSHILDISDRLRAADALRVAEAQFRSTFEDAPVGIALASVDPANEYFKRVNPAFCKLFGYSEEELYALPRESLVEPESRIANVVVQQRAPFLTEQQAVATKVYRAKDGHFIEAERYLSVVADADGRPGELLLQIVDNTARRVAERALHASEALHRLLIRNLPNVAVFLYDRDLRYTLADGDAMLSSLLGPEANKLVGRTVAEVANPDSRARVEAIYRRALDGETVSWIHRRGGRTFDCHTNPVRDETGGIVGGMTLLYETTDHTFLQTQLAESKARMSSLIENAADAMWSIDREGRITAFNTQYAEAALRIHGVHIFVGMNMFDFLSLTDRLEAMENHRRCLAGESISVESSVLVRGKVIHLLLSHNPIILGGVVVGASLMSKDVTARRELELAGLRQGRVVALMQAIATASNEASSSNAAIERCLKLVAEFADWSVGHAYTLGDDGALVSRGTWYLKNPVALESLRAATEKTKFRAREGLPGRVLNSKRSVWLASLEDDPRFGKRKVANELHHELVNGFAFPVLVGNEVATVVEFFSERDERPTERIVELMVNVGVQLGRVIERERHAAEVRALSLTDELTGLHNRRGFLALAGQQRLANVHAERVSTVLFADLDGLKRINDELGHEAGDDAITAFARVLRQTFRDGDIVSRFAGDEFVVFLEGSIVDGNAVLERLQRNLDNQNVDRPSNAHLAASMGLVEVCPDSTESMDSIIARADAEMYRIKRERRASNSP